MKKKRQKLKNVQIDRLNLEIDRYIAGDNTRDICKFDRKRL